MGHGSFDYGNLSPSLDESIADNQMQPIPENEEEQTAEETLSPEESLR
jgi:hypothetical protein